MSISHQVRPDLTLSVIRRLRGLTYSARFSSTISCSIPQIIPTPVTSQSTSAFQQITPQLVPSAPSTIFTSASSAGIPQSVSSQQVPPQLSILPPRPVPTPLLSPQPVPPAPPQQVTAQPVLPKGPPHLPQSCSTSVTTSVSTPSINSSDITLSAINSSAITFFSCCVKCR